MVFKDGTELSTVRLRVLLPWRGSVLFLNFEVAYCGPELFTKLTSNSVL